MEHWKFDDVYFFEGRILLNNKFFPQLSISIQYENCNETIDRELNLYGALQFTKVTWQADHCDPQYATAKVQLVIQELRSKLPPNFTTIFPTSAHLSELDTNANQYCLNAIQSVNEIFDLCKRRNASLKMEKG